MKGFTAFYGVLAPGKTPPDVVANLGDAMGKVISNPDFRAKLEKIVKERNIEFE